MLLLSVLFVFLFALFSWFKIIVIVFVIFSYGVSLLKYSQSKYIIWTLRLQTVCDRVTWMGQKRLPYLYQHFSLLFDTWKFHVTMAKWRGGGGHSYVFINGNKLSCLYPSVQHIKVLNIGIMVCTCIFNNLLTWIWKRQYKIVLPWEWGKNTQFLQMEINWYKH